jgi:hypothetical protein
MASRVNALATRGFGWQAASLRAFAKDVRRSRERSERLAKVDGLDTCAA